MVYRGRPSTGCMKCRERKIKCDERAEGCLKCFDRGFVCPGYDKNQIDRFFQDETARVKEKAQKAKAKALALREEEDMQIRAHKSISDIKEVIGAPMLCPLIDQGIAFFMSNYTVGLDEPPMSSHAYSKYLSTFGFHPIIATAMTALGLAGIANITNNTNFKRESMGWYTKALNMTNLALRNSSEVKSDNTLLATMLLSNFEATSNDMSIIGWVHHVEGSSSLLKMRGKEQFATPAGRRMYVQTAATMAMNCFGQGIEIPEYLHDLDEESRKYEEPQDPGIIFYHLQVKVTDFRAQVLSGKIFDLEEIVRTALELDEIAKTAFDAVGDEWMYEEVPTDANMPGVFGNVYHVYPHLAAAQTWNWIRYNRIYLHDIIRNALILGFSMSPPAFVGPEHLQQMTDSTQVLLKVQADILASYPQHLHDTPKVLSLRNDSSLMEHPAASSARAKYLWSNFDDGEPRRMFYRVPAEPKDRLPVIRVSGGYSAVWPLYVAGATPIASPESQQYVLTSLDRIVTEFGINQAKLLAGALKKKIQGDQSGEHAFGIVPHYLPKDF